MMSCLILAAMFIQSFGQTIINCTSNFTGAGYNSSLLVLVSRASVQGFPYPFSLYPSSYSNGTYISYQQIIDDNPAYLGSAITNTSRSNNGNFDCYQYVRWTNGSLNGQTTCNAYSMISFGANAFAYIGCYDSRSSQCPTACSPQYILANNHTFFGQFFLNNIAAAMPAKTIDTESAINHQKFRQSVNCDVVKGYNTSTIVYNAYGVPVVGYASIYSNGTYVAYTYNGTYDANGTYNISHVQSTSNDVQCNLWIMYQDGPVVPTIQCHSFSLAMNGSARVGCTSNNDLCPTSCNPQFVSREGNVWWTSFGLNRL